MKREICVENLMTVEIVAARVDFGRGTVINGVQCGGEVIWQILRKFTAAVTTGGRYLSPLTCGRKRLLLAMLAPGPSNRPRTL